MTIAERIEAERRHRKQGNWVPACGGTEQPFTTRRGFHLLYCWQPTTGNHAYIDLDRDIVLTDAEAMSCMGVTD